MNEVLEKLPAHLLSLVIEQPYNEYTSRDHAVWRYVMRQNVRYLSQVAHGSYLDGLKKTGISIDSIPHMYGMNRILKEIGWAAVAVDGFIPPSAFMEFQAYNVLVIAADIRPIDQIEYTPAPDIIHEAAGHAPIIADNEYAEYLKFFGQIGSKALPSARDYELYEAVRHLSILKADPYSSKGEIEAAQKHLAYIGSTMGEPSEMALIRNLHWWTVEYGLIGDLESPKIYGAGLLSSIGESYNCLQPKVKKLPYNIDAARVNFDITTQQPQLFVTPDFKHLSNVLYEFADSMALKVGGKIALERAEGSANTATIVLDSGVQISGLFSDSLVRGDEIVYLKTIGPSALAYENKQIYSHGKNYHRDGFGSPVGNLKNTSKPIYEFTESELGEFGIQQNKEVTLEYTSGVKVRGHLNGIIRQDGKNLLLTFQDCTVTYNEQILFKPSWGNYDMVIGQTVISAFAGPADPDAFHLTYKAPSETTHKITYSEKDRQLHNLYQSVRDCRDNSNLENDKNILNSIWEEIRQKYPNEWLLMLEILELTETSSELDGLSKDIFLRLKEIADKMPASKKLISDGLEMIKVSNVLEKTSN